MQIYKQYIFNSLLVRAGGAALVGFGQGWWSALSLVSAGGGQCWWWSACAAFFSLSKLLYMLFIWALLVFRGLWLLWSGLWLGLFSDRWRLVVWFGGRRVISCFIWGWCVFVVAGVCGAGLGVLVGLLLSLRM